MSTTGVSEHHEGMLPVVESIDVAKREDVHKLRPGAVGLIGVLFLTVTGSAPISAMLFNTPISVGFGNGIGTPAACSSTPTGRACVKACSPIRVAPVTGSGASSAPTATGS